MSAPEIATQCGIYWLLAIDRCLQEKPTVTIFAVGMAGFMAGPMMQTRIMQKAGGTPSLVSAAGNVYASPVATYSAPRVASIVGADQTAAPAGPHICVPTEFFFVGRGFSGMV